MARDDKYACYTKVRNAVRYQLHCDFHHSTGITGEEIETKFIELAPDGQLTVKEGFLWDGPTGAWRERRFMRGSLAHDALYELMRMGRLEPTGAHRKAADRLLETMLDEDGLTKREAKKIYKLVKTFNELALLRPPMNPTKVLYAANPEKFPKKGCTCNDDGADG